MHTVNVPARSRRQRLGGPLRVLLALDSAPLLLRMADTVRRLEGVQLAGSFNSFAQAVDWLVWDREGWHVAFVDLGLPDGGGEQLVRRLLGQPRPGTVVALGDHLWREVRERCAAMGVSDLLEKGDVIAFQSYLEARVL